MKYDWPEHLCTPTVEIGEVDPNDDLKRELAFYKQAVAAAQAGQELCKKHSLPFSRPNDYFAEMFKSDVQMQRIQTRLTEDLTSLQKSEQAKRQRQQRKIAKKVQTETLLKRQEAKKQSLDKIKQWRNKGSSVPTDASTGAPRGASRGGGRGGGRGGSTRGRGRGGAAGGGNVKREERNKKFGFGGKKRFSKANSAESTANPPSFKKVKLHTSMYANH